MSNNSTNSTTILKYDCIARSPGIASIMIALLALPFHMFMLRILIFRLRLVNPRHKILLSLSIADIFQFVISAIFVIISFAFHLESDSKGCLVIRKILEFNGLVTVVASSGSIVALSIERYIACIYCLRLYAILTDKRVVRALAGLWVVSLISGFSVIQPIKPTPKQTTIDATPTMSIICMITIFTSTLILLAVQSRLFLVSRSKLKVEPGEAFGSKQEESDTRKRHLKLAVASSAVVVLYMICMVPLAVFTAYNFGKGNNPSKLRQVVIGLATVNTFFDPFVYGLGMADTKHEIKKDLKDLKTYITDKFGSGTLN